MSINNNKKYKYNNYKYIINKIFKKDEEDNIKINFSEIALMFDISDMTIADYYNQYKNKSKLIRLN